MDKAMCARIDKIQSELVENALKLYNEGKYADFWGAVGSLDVFLSVKEGLGCPIRKRRK